jgi:tetratricopeptide (TPR) repeat protein
MKPVCSPILFAALLSACAASSLQVPPPAAAQEKSTDRFSVAAMTDMVFQIEEALSSPDRLAELHRGYEKEIQLKPQHPFWRFLWAYSMSDRNQAWLELSKITKLNDKFFWAYLGMGVILDGWGVYDQAEANLSRAVQLQPKLPLGLARLGRLYLHLKDASRAVELLGQAVELDSGRTAYQLDLARALWLAEKRQAAIETFQKALLKSPPSFELAAELALMLQQDGQLPASADAYARAIEINPAACQVMISRANILLQLNRVDEALEQRLAACRCRPAEIACWKALGQLAAKHEKPDLLRRAYEQALDIDPRDLESCRALGPVYLKSGELEKAQAALQTVLEAEPENKEALAGLAEISERGGQFGQALELTERLLRLEPDHPLGSQIRKRLFVRFQVLEQPITGSSPQAVFNANRKQIAQVYRERLKKKPSLAGDLLIKVTVNNQGEVTSVTVARDTLGDEILSMCALWNLRRSRFPAGMGATYDFELGLRPGQ